MRKKNDLSRDMQFSSVYLDRAATVLRSSNPTKGNQNCGNPVSAKRLHTLETLNSHNNDPNHLCGGSQPRLT